MTRCEYNHRAQYLLRGRPESIHLRSNRFYRAEKIEQSYQASLMLPLEATRNRDHQYG